jgi:NADPH-dependent curcumin reductase CurA
MISEITLASRPKGWPTAENFALVRVETPPPADGQVLVRNLYMSVDPYMRGRMNDVRSYVPPFQIGQPLEGAAVGEIVESRAADLKPGDLVTSTRGWRDGFVADAKDVRRVSRSVEPLSAYLGVLGSTGFTAWLGLNLVDVKAGDIVFVSAAAGAVGSVAGQLAKLRGCRVIGAAGSAEKVNVLVNEFGFDAAFNYKDGAIAEQLRVAAPDGIDVYFDNVGGEHLEAALSAMRNHGRIVACGAISRYNDEAPTPGPRNLFLMIGKRLTMRGFLVFDSMPQMPAFLNEVRPYLAEGRLRAKETVVEGLERAPQAFIDLLRGKNIGKMIVKLTTSN